MLSSAIRLPKRNKQRFQRQTKPGTPPGTVVPPPSAHPPVIRVTHYGPEECSEHEISQLSQLESVVAKSGVTWIDVDGLGDADIIVQIGKMFGLHPLAMEDVVNVHQRAKLEMYGDYLFLVARAQTPDESLNTEQVAMFLSKNIVITFQEHDVDCLESVRRRIVTDQGRIRHNGADYLLYALLDAVVDSYFPALEKYGEKLDALDDLISSSGEQNLIDKIHNVRSELLHIRRSVWPLREAINNLIRDSGDLISDDTDLYLRDCYDHTVQMIDVIETDRELCADLRDFYLTVVGNRMNQVMKFLTIIATLFIPLSFITGLYGMNFNPKVSTWNMPELNWAFGYPFALVLMVAVSAGLISFFWRKGWLT